VRNERPAWTVERREIPMQNKPANPDQPTPVEAQPVIDEARIAEIRARVEQATKGPWEPYDNHIVLPDVGAVEFDSGNPIPGDSSNDTRFIAHAREDVPYLLSALDASQAKRQAAERERDLAIAHDRQPYPTAHAYKAVCAARTKWQAKAEAAEQALSALREAMRAVVVQWREVDTDGHAHDPSVAWVEARVQCADELSQLLSSNPSDPKS
jgi:hypothetical protein